MGDVVQICKSGTRIGRRAARRLLLRAQRIRFSNQGDTLQQIGRRARRLVAFQVTCDARAQLSPCGSRDDRTQQFAELWNFALQLRREHYMWSLWLTDATRELQLGAAETAEASAVHQVKRPQPLVLEVLQLRTRQHSNTAEACRPAPGGEVRETLPQLAFRV